MEGFYFASRKKKIIDVSRQENGIWPILVQMQSQCHRTGRRERKVGPSCMVYCSFQPLEHHNSIHLHFLFSLSPIEKGLMTAGWFKQLVPFHTCWQLLSDSSNSESSRACLDLKYTHFIFLIWNQFLKASSKT